MRKLENFKKEKTDFSQIFQITKLTNNQINFFLKTTD